MNLFSFSRVGSLLFLALAVTGTTIVGGSSNQAWADVIEGTVSKLLLLPTDHFRLYFFFMSIHVV
jgi:hypothetical protein